MIEDKLNLEIIENVENNRVDEEFIADYFEYKDKYKRIDVYTHLYYIDLRYSNDVILSDRFTKL
jgi:hypothetical protein